MKRAFLGMGRSVVARVAFTPKDGCPLKLRLLNFAAAEHLVGVAFTPKGGCPLKPHEHEPHPNLD